ncbi:MAG: hypothetical protein ACN4E2_00930, partial [Nitrospinota bacterium]
NSAITLDETARLDGVVIRGGNAAADDDIIDGGGIYNSGSVSPTIISTIVENNRADNGGGIYNEKGASPTIISSIIQYNYANNYGGGIFTYNSASSKIESSIIQYNHTNGYGGGISTSGTAAGASAQSYVTASLIKSNYAIYGGGVYGSIYSGSFYKASVIKNNGASYNGGGVYSADRGAVTRITSSIIQSNFASDNDGGTGGGGGIYIGQNALLGLVNSAVIENISNSTGGGISGKNGIRRIQIYNSIVSDNIANRADLPEQIEIDSSSNGLEKTVVFSSIVKSVSDEEETSSEAKVTFYNMLDGTDAPELKAIDFGSYREGGKTYTLPNPVTTVVKSLAPDLAYSHSGVEVGVDSDGDLYYKDGAWYNFKNEELTGDLPEITTITGKDIYGKIDFEKPDIGPVIIPAFN